MLTVFIRGPLPLPLFAFSCLYCDSFARLYTSLNLSFCPSEKSPDGYAVSCALTLEVD